MESKKMKWLQTAQLVLLSAVIFCIPSNLFYQLLPNYGYVGGLQVDYLIPKLYLVDLLILGILGSQMITVAFAGQPVSIFARREIVTWFKKQLTPTTLLLATCYLLLLTRQLFTPFPISAVWFLLQTTLRIGFGGWLVGRFQKHNSQPYRPTALKPSWLHEIFDILYSTLYLPLLLTLIFQSALGLYQFLTQRTLLGFWFLGEPTLHSQPGLATSDFHWLDGLIGTSFGLRILPYGTTPHPNVLAGFLVVGTLLLFQFLIFNFKVLFQARSSWQLLKILGLLLITCFVLLCLFLTQSVSAWLSLLIGLGYLSAKKVFLRYQPAVFISFILAILIMPIFLSILSSRYSQLATLTRRNELNIAALKMIWARPVAGVGMNQFAAVLEEVHTQNEVVRFIQPAHHTVLLFVAENGVLGVLIVMIFMRSTKNTAFFSVLLSGLILLPIIGLDHYLYSLPQGQLLSVLLLCFITSLDKNTSTIKSV